jgi:hypothetical protein
MTMGQQRPAMIRRERPAATHGVGESGDPAPGSARLTHGAHRMVHLTHATHGSCVSRPRIVRLTHGVGDTPANGALHHDAPTPR